MVLGNLSFKMFDFENHKWDDLAVIFGEWGKDLQDLGCHHWAVYKNKVFIMAGGSRYKDEGWGYTNLCWKFDLVIGELEEIPSLEHKL